MFLHIVAIDRQLTVHAVQGEPLGKALSEAFRFHKKRQVPGLVVTVEDGRELDPAKTPEENSLADDTLVLVKPAPPKAPEPVAAAPEPPASEPARATRPRRKAQAAPATSNEPPAPFGGALLSNWDVPLEPPQLSRKAARKAKKTTKRRKK